MADYNPDTALAIVSSGGYVDTLLGTIIPLVPISAPYLALVLLFFNRVIPAILMLLATAFMSPVIIARPAALALPRQRFTGYVLSDNGEQVSAAGRTAGGHIPAAPGQTVATAGRDRRGRRRPG